MKPTTFESQRKQLFDLAHRLDGTNKSQATMPCEVIDQLRKFNIPIVKDLDAKILHEVEQDRKRLRMQGSWHWDAEGNSIIVDDIRSCGTAHCRAGWAIVLAGQEGINLSLATHPEIAGILIYAASMPTFPIPNFYAEDKKAIADMEARVKAMQTEGE